MKENTRKGWVVVTTLLLIVGLSVGIVLGNSGSAKASSLVDWQIVSDDGHMATLWCVTDKTIVCMEVTRVVDLKTKKWVLRGRRFYQGRRSDIEGQAYANSKGKK